MRMRFERMFARSQIKLIDIEIVYEALFLRATTSFEAFLEELFCQILLNKVQYPTSRVTRIVNFASAQSLYRFVWRNDKYLEWLKYEKTEERARVFLSGGRPFRGLDEGIRSRIKPIATIRNAIAHSSDHARKEFRRIVIGNQPFSPRDRTPARYLRTVFIAVPLTRRYQQVTDDILLIASELMP